MHSPYPPLDPTLVVRHAQNQQKRRRQGNSQLPTAKSNVSTPAGERDSSRGGSSVASTIHGDNSTPSCSLNNSGMGDITQRVTLTPSATQRRSIYTPTARLGTSRHGTPAPGGISLTDSTCHVVSSPASSNASTPSTVSGPENQPTPIPNPEARAIINNPLRTRATEMNLSQRQWQLRPQTVSTPRSMLSSSCSIHRSGHSDMTWLGFETGRLMELYMWNRSPFMSASHLEMVSYAMRCLVKVLAEAPHWQIIETYWNTAMQQNKIRSIPFEACTKEILRDLC